VYGQRSWKCKYLRMCCVYFRTCPPPPHTHTQKHKRITPADTLRSTPKPFRVGSSLKDVLICRNTLCGLFIDKPMNTCTYIGT
jgi:hypothetical protein